ncbi:MAG TPA: glycerol-3-phosphate 1-O-acyltransferase PlsY [Afifellaceae bacterium]|nr:glycerol-3-phosphate 1-O-acyltransferase PlsY [Afifellaceae bacterium]
MADPISWAVAWPYLLAAAIGGYLIGSISFGVLLTQLAGVGDVRRVGSGNIGATNVLRTGRKGLAALTLLGDALKGTAAVLAAGLAGPEAAIVAGFFAFLGHCFPAWLKFRGGKGVATYLGVLLGFSWVAMLIAGAVWLATAAVTRYSSLSALIASAATPPILFLLGHIQWAELFLLLTIILWLRHRGNISRLMAGEEGRIGGA